MIKANNKTYDWFQDMTLIHLFKTMGYALEKPAVLVEVNNEVIRRTAWDHFHIPNKAEISVVKFLPGG